MTKPTLVPRTSPERPSCARQPPTAACPPAGRARATTPQPARSPGLSPPPQQLLRLFVRVPGEEQTPLQQGSAREMLSCSLHGLGKLGDGCRRWMPNHPCEGCGTHLGVGGRRTAKDRSRGRRDCAIPGHGRRSSRHGLGMNCTRADAQECHSTASRVHSFGSHSLCPQQLR